MKSKKVLQEESELSEKQEQNSFSCVENPLRGFLEALGYSDVEEEYEKVRNMHAS